MTDQNKSLETLQLEVMLKEIQQNLTIARGTLKEAEADVAEVKVKSARVKQILNRNLEAAKKDVEDLEDEMRHYQNQLQFSSLIKKGGVVSINDIHKVGLDHVEVIEVPTVSLLPICGEIRTDLTGTLEGSAAAATSHVNMQKYQDIIECSFDDDYINEQAFQYMAMKMVRRILGDEVVERVREEARNGSRPPISLRAVKVSVAIKVDSPGGSPSESYNLATKIRREAKKSGLPVLTFTENLAASGGYFLLASGDKAYVASPFTQVGCIGVVGGYAELTERGKKMAMVRKHILTSGKNKRCSMDDPHTETKQEDIDKYLKSLEEAHELFNDFVRENRGESLKGDDEERFSGETFSAKKALELGLIDGIVQYEDILEEMYGHVFIDRLVVTDPALGGLPYRSASSSKQDDEEGMTASVGFQPIEMRELSSK